jgi:hypothetical protein
LKIKRNIREITATLVLFFREIAVCYIFSVKSSRRSLIFGKMPKRKNSALSGAYRRDKRKNTNELSQLSRDENRIRMETFREEESEEAGDERRHSDRIATSRLRDWRSRTEQAVPPPPEPTQK